jgi:glycosyltransferase involved in cell wall biosynthesis
MKPVLSIVVPAYNEAEGLAQFHRRLQGVLDGVGLSAEILFVNDGSSDATRAVLDAIRSEDSRVAIVDLSRNFGKEIALTAGLDHALGDAVVVIDADLQDPPELIPTLIERWREGYDVVYARRTRRTGESLLKKTTAKVFYRIMAGIGSTAIPTDTGDFRLLSRRAVDALTRLRERHRFMKGLFSWIGYRQVAVEYVREPRFTGNTKWNYWKLWNFAIEGFTSFTIAPLKIATYIGVSTAAAAFVYATGIIVRTLVHGRDVPGYASLMVAVLFLGGIQLMSLGVLGEYVGRMFNETKGRPLYLIHEYLPARHASMGDHPGPALTQTSDSNSLR